MKVQKINQHNSGQKRLFPSELAGKISRLSSAKIGFHKSDRNCELIERGSNSIHNFGKLAHYSCL